MSDASLTFSAPLPITPGDAPGPAFATGSKKARVSKENTFIAESQLIAGRSEPDAPLQRSAVAKLLRIFGPCTGVWLAGSDSPRADPFLG